MTRVRQHFTQYLWVLLLLAWPPTSGADQATAPPSIDYARIRFQEANLAPPGAFGSGFLQDRDGFFWLGLQSGLGKWDGRTLKLFDTRNSKLSSLAISGLLEDRNGQIWIATLGGGLNRYDKSSDSFTVYRHSPEQPESISSNNLGGLFYKQTLAEDGQGRIWITSDGDGLNRFDKQSGTFTRYFHDPKHPHSLSSNRVLSVYVGRSQSIWVGTQSGLNRYNAANDHFERIPLGTETLDRAAIRALHEDREGLLWLGTTNHGLIRFNPQNGQSKQFLPEQNQRNSLANILVCDIAEDAQGKLWLTHLDKRISIFDQERETFVQHLAAENTPGRLHGDQISDIYVDRRGTVWVLAHGGRLNKYDRNANKFTLYQHDPDDVHSIPSNSVRNAYRDRQGQMWFNANAFGFFRYLPQIDAFQRHVLPGKAHRPFLDDQQGLYWLGGYNASNQPVLRQLDRATLKIKAEFPLPAGDFSNHMIEDPEDSDILWFGTINQGLGRFDKRSKRFDFFTHDRNNPQSIGGNTIWDLAVDQQDPNFLWLAIDGGGLNRFDKRQQTFLRHTHRPDDPTSLRSNSVFSFRQTRAGEFWVMAKGGALERFDKASGQFEHFSETNGRFPDDKAVNLLEDQQGNLWVNGPGGHIIWFDPRSGKSRLYGRDDGVQTGAAWSGGNMAGADGRLWFAGGEGLNAFFPEQIRELKFEPKVVITSLTQSGEPVALGNAPELSQELQINWRNNFFEFSYAALDFTHPELNQYQYKLEGWDEDWYKAGNRTHGRYSNLPGGRYTLRIRGTNSDGLWSPNEARLQILVTPPFWQTWWLKGLILLMTLGLVAATYLIRTTRIRAHNRELQQHRDELEQRVEERTQELQRTMEQLVQAEKMGALGQLVAGVAHELNTPLGNARLAGSLLEAHTQEFASECQSNRLQRSQIQQFIEQNLEAIGLLERNLAQAAELIANFKQVAIDQASTLRRKFFLRQIINELFATLKPQLLRPPCQVEIDIPEDLELDSHAGPIEQVLAQLVNNSLLHGLSGRSSGTLQISATAIDARRIRLIYQDDGNGISPAIQNRIFDPFFTTSFGHGSNGLGLYIVYNLITGTLGGSIKVLSAPGQGCRFEIVLPRLAPENPKPTPEAPAP